MNEKILITGAAGFIGSHLFNRLASQGNKVLGLDNYDHPCGAEIPCQMCDVRYPSLMNELVKESDIVYHLAAQTHVDRSYDEEKLTFDVNVGGTENVLKACRIHGKKLVYAGSAEVYGTAAMESISEGHPLNPQSPYARSKKAAEDLCIEYAKRHGLDVRILRSFNTYGPFQNNNRYGAVIPIFIKRILNGQSPEIFGAGNQTRDFMYIDDAVDAYRVATEKANAGEPLNFGTGSETSINDLAALILRLLGSNLTPVHAEPRPDEVMKLKADITRARGLGFGPKISLEDGLKKYIGWYRNRIVQQDT